jgi:virginiamycin B lyase
MDTRLLVLLLYCWASSPAVADTADVREWLVPWANSSPTDPYVDARGRVWFVGARGDYIANFSSDDGEFNRYDLRDGTAPSALLVSADRQLWFASRKRRHIGVMNPSTGRVTLYDMPDRKAREPRSLAFDDSGDIWFTAENSQFIGRLRVADGEIELVELPGRKPRPFGIAVAQDGQIWVAASGRNALFRIEPTSLTVTSHDVPDRDARPHRIGITSDGSVWYTDRARGLLGRLSPDLGQFTEWPMPGGPDSEPLAMAVDRYDRLWIVETGRDPNRLIGFDPASGVFLTTTDIPSGAGSVSHLHYSEASGEVWFGTETNYLGRAVVH